jgi:hypothetical protein
MGLMMFINPNYRETDFGSLKSCYFIQTSNHNPKTRTPSYRVSVVSEIGPETSRVLSTFYFIVIFSFNYLIFRFSCKGQLLSKYV